MWIHSVYRKNKFYVNNYHDAIQLVYDYAYIKVENILCLNKILLLLFRPKKVEFTLLDQAGF